ncbi:hypothetical protein TruAng_003284 [Truncatella angustata]|nr:hypothetical protein TruAng_003284 [Truncatella angustata]
MGFVHFDTTPFTSPVVKDDTRSPAASSDYPSEGIRSEECLSPPDDGKLSIRQGEFNLSGLHEYYYSGPRERTSEMRSTSVTDAAGPHIRNTSTSLQDELATANAGPNVFDEGSTTASDADRSSQGSSSRKSSATMIGRTFTGEKLVKVRARAEGWSCATVDGAVIQCTWEDDDVTPTDTHMDVHLSGALSKADGKYLRKSKIRKWVKKTWGKTAGRLFLKQKKVNKGREVAEPDCLIRMGRTYS